MRFGPGMPEASGFRDGVGTFIITVAGVKSPGCKSVKDLVSITVSQGGETDTETPIIIGGQLYTLFGQSQTLPGDKLTTNLYEERMGDGGCWHCWFVMRRCSFSENLIGRILLLFLFRRTRHFLTGRCIASCCSWGLLFGAPE